MSAERLRAGRRFRRALCDFIAPYRAANDNRKIPIIALEEIVSREWASATFSGFRHEFALTVRGESKPVALAVETIKRHIDEGVFGLRREIVADVKLVGADSRIGRADERRDRLRFEALTIFDD